MPEELVEILRESREEGPDLTMLKTVYWCGEAHSVRLSGESRSIEFACGPFDCATVLSKDPRFVVELLTRSCILAHELGVSQV